MPEQPHTPQRWLITGASGQLGGHLLRILAARDRCEVLALAGRGEVLPGPRVRRIDLADLNALHRCAADFFPTHVIHAGALTAVSACHADPPAARRVNVDATRVLADAAADCGARFVLVSTDMVFDGTAAPYRETDPPSPLSVYGRTKADAETAVRGLPGSLVVRVPLMYGVPCTSRETTFTQQLVALRSGRPLRLFVDEFRTPVWLADAARALLGLAQSARTGVIHLSGPQRLSRCDLILRVAELLGIDEPNIERISRRDLPAPEPRPADLSLDGAVLAREFPQLVPGPLRPEALHPTATAQGTSDPDRRRQQAQRRQPS